jgi:transposase
MRFVAPKSVEQQDLLAVHRIRARLVGQRTGLCNQIRGLLAEYGIVLPQAISRLRRALPEVLEDAENELTVQGRQLIASLREELCELEERIKPYEHAIERASIDSWPCRRLRSIPGIGPIGATAVVATKGVQERPAFRGLSRPGARQHSSGGKSQLGRISRRGDVYVRRILIQGAHAILKRVGQREGPRTE